MNARQLICTFLFVGAFAACAGSTESEEAGTSNALGSPVDSLFHEVMDGHDAGMAKVGRLRKYSQQLAHQIDSITKSSNSSSNITELQRVKDSLDRAHAAMFEWMDGFKADTLTASTDRRMQYLQAQKTSVLLVRDRIMNSIRLYDSLQGK